MKNNTSTAKILDFLRKKAGQKITLKQLVKEVNSAAEKNRKQKSREKTRNKRKQKNHK